MNKIINKKNMFYAVTILNFIYLSFLINRINQNRFIAKFFIIFLCVALGCFGLYHFQKNKNVKKIEKNSKKLILGSILGSLLIFFMGFSFFCANYKSTEITLKNNQSNFDFIDYIQVDKISYRYNGKCFIGNFEPYCTNKIKLSKTAGKNYKLNFAKSSRIKILFNQKANNLIVKENGQKKVIKSNLFEYKVSSNCYYNFFSMIYGILSLEFIAFILFMIFSYIISLKESNKKMFMGVLIVCFLISIFYFNISELGLQYPDSKSYIGFKFSSFFHLKFSDRVFIYPVIIRICRHLFLDNYLIWVCIFQYIFHFISILYFYRLIYLLTKNEKVAGLSSVLYALMPAISGWNNLILTESIALSGTMLFIYYIIDYIKNHQLKSGFFAVIIALLLTFERPTSLILVVALFGFFLLRFLFERKEFKNDFKCFIGSIISLVIIVIYAFIFHRTQGIYSLTNALVRQDLFVNIQEGYYTSSSNKEFVKMVKTSLNPQPEKSEIWSVLNELFKKYKNSDIQKINRECRSKNLPLYRKYIYQLIQDNSSVTFSSYPLYNVETLSLQETFSGFTFLSSYIAILLELIVAIYLWIKNKKVPWIDLGLCIFPFVIILSSYIGTCDEFMRTSICAVLFTYISYIILITRFLNLEKK